MPEVHAQDSTATADDVAPCVRDLSVAMPRRDPVDLPPPDGATGVAPSILWKAFAILEAFSQDGRHLSLSQISRRTGLPKSTTHRVVKMLIELEALERHGEDYRVGSRLFSLGCRFPRIRLRDAARPHLQALATRTGQAAQLAVLQDSGVLLLDVIGEPSRLYRIAVGDRLDVHRAALGRVLLAFAGDGLAGTIPGDVNPQHLADQLVQIRMTRFAADHGETVRTRRCVAVPVLRNGCCLAAVAVTFPAAVGPDHMFVGTLQEAAARIAQTLERDGLLPNAD